MRRLALGILVALALLPAATAQADAVDGGSIHLKLTSALTRAFKQDGVRLAGLGPASAGKTGVTLPISQGLLERQHGSGYLFLGGGFKLRAGKRSVRVTDLVLDINGRALRGKVNGTAMKIAEPSPQRATVDGFDLDLALGALKLTGRAAGTLNRKLGLHGVFVARHSLASVTAVAEFEFLTVSSGEISFTIDPRFKEKLASIEADVLASEAAKVVGTSPTVISMPVWGGQISPDPNLSLGVLLSNGGLEFVQHDEPFDHTIAFLTTRIALDSKLVSGAANVDSNPQHGPYGAPFGIFPSGSTGQANPETGEVSGMALPIVLRTEFAALLNEVFGAPKGHPEFFTGGEFLGSFSFRVQTR